jgi:exoribonuclease R
LLRELLQTKPHLSTGAQVEAGRSFVSAAQYRARKQAKRKADDAEPARAFLSSHELELIAEESSERERAADAAEKEVDEWRKAKFMAERLGEEFEGMIINVRDFGFYVELDEFYIEGLVPVATLTDDFYQYDERRHTLTGRSGRRAFRLGVRVRVDRVNVDRHLVDFSVVEEGKSRTRNTRK